MRRLDPRSAPTALFSLPALPGRIIVFAAAALIVGCDNPTEPEEEPMATAGSLSLRAPTHHGGKTSECSRRVDIHRMARAEAGVNGMTPDSVAEETMSGSGGFQASFGASSGGNGRGAQAWTKHSTMVNCDSWSIGRQGLLLLDGQRVR